MVRILVFKNNIYFWAVNVFAIDQTVQNKNFTQVLIVCCVDFRVTSHSKHFQLASNNQSQLSSAAHGLSKFCFLDQAIMTSNPNSIPDPFCPLRTTHLCPKRCKWPPRISRRRRPGIDAKPHLSVGKCSKWFAKDFYNWASSRNMIVRKSLTTPTGRLSSL